MARHLILIPANMKFKSIVIGLVNKSVIENNTVTVLLIQERNFFKQYSTINLSRLININSSFTWKFHFHSACQNCHVN